MRISDLRPYVLRFFDVILAVLSINVAEAVLFPYLFTDHIWSVIIVGAVVQAVVFSVFFYIVNIYRIVWYYSSLQEMMKLILSAVISQMVSFVIHVTVISALSVSTSALDLLKIHLLSGCFVVVATVILRVVVYSIERRNKIGLQSKDKKGNNNTMIIGAGDACHLFIYEMSSKHSDEYNIKCIIDDDKAKLGMLLDGVKVVGNRYTIEENVKKYEINKIVFAIPSCPDETKTDILNICAKTNCAVKIMPSVFQMVSGGFNDDKEYVKQIREVEIEDLLGREPIKIDIESVMDYVKDKVVIVTGGGGSIGSELCRQIAFCKPKRLIIFDIYENNAYDIQLELKSKYPMLDLVVLIGSVRDNKRLDMIFDKYRPDIVYHAAAHKHVPLMEDSPNEAVKNNVIGTLNVVQMADKFNAKKFVMISTDKAVNPTNIMGASKRICEMIVQEFNRYSETEFVAVRFGNVLGSNGSVIPLFKKQIKEGGPVTVTHPDIIRYFMTIPEAVSLVLQAGAYAKNGEIFVLDMGKPVKILDLAENLIRLSGFEPYKDIDIKFTGLRPGEKLYEELLMNEEGLKATENELIHIGKPIDIDGEHFWSTLHKMKYSMEDDTVDMRSLIKEIVPTYVIKR